jgi:hypothetical protein
MSTIARASESLNIAVSLERLLFTGRTKRRGLGFRKPKKSIAAQDGAPWLEPRPASDASRDGCPSELKLVIAHYDAGSRKRGGLLGQVGCANGKELPIASPLLLSLIATINTVAVSVLRGH